MNCPQCNGEKVIFGIFPVWADEVPQKDRKPVIQLPCDFCDETGMVDDEYPQRYEAGQKVRNIRCEKEITLREFAKRFTIDTLKLSQYERGKKIDAETESKIKNALNEI